MIPEQLISEAAANYANGRDDNAYTVETEMAFEAGVTFAIEVLKPMMSEFTMFTIRYEQNRKFYEPVLSNEKLLDEFIKSRI